MPGVDAGQVVWLLAVFLISLAGTWLAVRYARWARLIDEPGERRSHAIATARGGGIGIVVALLFALVWLGIRDSNAVGALTAAAFGMLLVATVGWIDDHRPQSPWIRLSAHVIAAAALACSVHFQGSGWMSAVIVFVLAVGLVNIWNFMDGIDGMAASQAAVVSVSFAAILGNDQRAACFALALGSACLGFLPFNLPKARIFMGDVGSGTLGFALAIIVSFSISRMESAPWSWGVLWLLPPSAFLVDATLTLASRILRHERWWNAHVEHGYQRWVQWGTAHWRVTLAYAAWSAMAGVVAYPLRDTPKPVAVATVLLFYSGGWILWTRLRRVRALSTGK